MAKETKIAGVPGWLDRLLSWNARRQERALDKAAIGSERVVGGLGNDFLYEAHGWEPVESLRIHTGAGVQSARRYRKVREADPAAVAELHGRLGW